MTLPRDALDTNSCESAQPHTRCDSFQDESWFGKLCSAEDGCQAQRHEMSMVWERSSEPLFTLACETPGRGGSCHDGGERQSVEGNTSPFKRAPTQDVSLPVSAIHIVPAVSPLKAIAKEHQVADGFSVAQVVCKDSRRSVRSTKVRSSVFLAAAEMPQMWETPGMPPDAADVPEQLEMPEIPDTPPPSLNRPRERLMRGVSCAIPRVVAPEGLPSSPSQAAAERSCLIAETSAIPGMPQACKSLVPSQVVAAECLAPSDGQASPAHALPAAGEGEDPFARTSWRQTAAIASATTMSAGVVVTAATGVLPVTVALVSVSAVIGALGGTLGMRLGRWTY